MAKKKKVYKTDADKGLVVEQFNDLDTEFYNNYPKEFFLIKLQDILVRISQPGKVSAALNGEEIQIGKLSAKELDDSNEWDVYIVAKDFSWTYVRTHERDYCGPYFCKLK